MRPLFDIPGHLKFSYERLDDPEKNSFGPSQLRLYVTVGTNVNDRLLVGDLKILESHKEGGLSVPTTAELRQLSQRRGQEEVKVAAIFRLSDISIDKASSRTHDARPEITRQTLISDYRLGTYLEYVSESWTTPAQANQILQSGKARLALSASRIDRRSIAVLLVTIISSLIGLSLFRLAYVRSKHNKTSNHERLV